VKDYLFKRGLSEATIQEFKLGFAPDDWRSLTNYLIKEGFKPEEILQSGLAISKKTYQRQDTKYRRQIFTTGLDQELCFQLKI